MTRTMCYPAGATTLLCSNPEVSGTVAAGPAAPAGPQQQQQAHVLLKVRAPAAPGVDSFLVALFQGPSPQLQPWQVWAVHVHALRPVSLPAKLGQADSASLVLHSGEGQAGRCVQAFTSQPLELQVGRALGLLKALTVACIPPPLHRAAAS